MRESWSKRDWPLPVLFLAIVRLSLWIRERMFGGIAMENRSALNINPQRPTSPNTIWCLAQRSPQIKSNQTNCQTNQ
jgi:hypothetical protein